MSTRAGELWDHYVRLRDEQHLAWEAWKKLNDETEMAYQAWDKAKKEDKPRP